ncbi:hypothetical protein ACQJBY_068639 [Aegilops geniculata]
MFFLLEPATYFAGTVFVFCYHASFCFAGMNAKLLQICYHRCFDLLEPAPVFATTGIFGLMEQHPIFQCLLPLAFQFAGTNCIFCYHCCLLRAMASSPLILQGTGGLAASVRGVRVATVGGEGTDAHCVGEWGGAAAAMAPRVLFSQLKKATDDGDDRGQRRALVARVGGGNEVGGRRQ